MSQDPYLDPRAGVLRNRLGLTDPGELDRAEADLTGYRLVELHERALPGAYDLAHLQAFHRLEPSASPVLPGHEALSSSEVPDHPPRP